jgi:tetratricopeptide (TPR) repeat protein
VRVSVANQPARRWANFLACVVIVLAGLAAYHNTFSVPFLLDDPSSITDNPSIRRLWPLWAPLSPPHGAGLSVEGRPLLNLSLALNYAISGTEVWSYHALNLVIHLLAGLTLFGLVRRTLVANRHVATASPALFALAAALLWTLHPLQTESVTYVIQRAESLMGLFYLLTLYGFVRGAQCHPLGDNAQRRGRGWLAVSIVACALGMATKEVMVTAPVIVLLYDYTFVAGSLRAVWSRRRGYYLALAATWLLLLGLALDAGNRGGTIGRAAGVEWWEFALTQSRAIPHYLALVFWPQPLIFDYGSDFVNHVAAVAPYLLLDGVLLAAVGFGLWRRSAAGFFGASFFVLLAPSSSVVGGTRQMLAEHRMYLPLAAVVLLALLGVHALCGRRGLRATLALVPVLGLATARRNADYRDPLSLWSDTVAKRPGNPWAQNDLGVALLERDRVGEAVEHLARAVQLKPGYADARDNFGNALIQQGRLGEALEQYEQAVRLRPDFASAHSNFANALLQAGRPAEAMAHYEMSLRLDPAQPDAQNNLGNLLAHTGRPAEAIRCYEAALHERPGFAAAHYNLGNVLATQRHLVAARAQYEAALRLRPDYPEARTALARLGAAQPP